MRSLAKKVRCWTVLRLGRSIVHHWRNVRLNRPGPVPAGAVRLPIEVSYSHIETFSGSSGMVPRAGRDQIQLRLYYRVRR